MTRKHYELIAAAIRKGKIDTEDLASRLGRPVTARTALHCTALAIADALDSDGGGKFDYSRFLAACDVNLKASE